MSRAHICTDGRLKREYTDTCTFDCKQKLVFNNLAEHEFFVLDEYLWYLTRHLRETKRELETYKNSLQMEANNKIVICKYSHICKDIDAVCKHKIPHVRVAEECSINSFCDIIYEDGCSCIPIKKKEHIKQKKIINRPIDYLLP